MSDKATSKNDKHCKIFECLKREVLMMRSEESGRGKLTKAFKVSAANGFCGNSLICVRIYFHQPPVYPQLMLQCVTKFFQESVYILSWARLLYIPSPSPNIWAVEWIIHSPTIIHHFPSNEAEGLSIITLPTQ